MDVKKLSGHSIAKDYSSYNDYSGYNFTCKERFLRYVKIDTQSDDNSNTSPSTEKQKVLLKILMSELKKMNIDAKIDNRGYIYAKFKSNTSKRVPAIGFLAHVDTSSASPGANVLPIVHQNYNGKDITLPKESQTVKVCENPDLKKMIGHDIITSDGSSLLGADDKAGVAAIMDAVNFLVKHPQIKHGDVMIGFTTDEEIGRGVENFDIKKFGAKYAYTLDGESLGDIEYETFNADKLIINITGRSTHTGYAKGKMINSMKLASEFISNLPKKLSPEHTNGMKGFIHVSSISGNEESTDITMLLRDFDEKKLSVYHSMIKNMLDTTIKKHKGSRYTIERVRQYRNMKKIIDKNPRVIKYAIKAMKNIGITPCIKRIRGGTDGCNLSYMGLPTPNIFCGEHNFHSKTEFVSATDMKSAVMTIIGIIKTWEENS